LGPLHQLPLGDPQSADTQATVPTAAAANLSARNGSTCSSSSKPRLGAARIERRRGSPKNEPLDAAVENQEVGYLAA